MHVVVPKPLRTFGRHALGYFFLSPGSTGSPAAFQAV